MVFKSVTKMTYGENGYGAEALPQPRGLAMFRGFIEEEESAKDLKKGGKMCPWVNILPAKFNTLTRTHMRTAHAQKGRVSRPGPSIAAYW